MTDLKNHMPSENTQSLSDGIISPKPKKSRFKRIIKGLLWLVVMSIAVLMCTLTWLLTTESGLRFALMRAPQFADIRITSDSLQGSLWRGFSGEKWLIETPTAKLSISKLSLDWQANELFSRVLHIRHLAIGDVHLIESHDSPPQEDKKEASILPESISLPVQIHIDSIEIGKFSQLDTENILLNHAKLAYHYNHQNHQLDIIDIATPWSTSMGKLALQTASPYPLSGQINNVIEIEQEKINNTIMATGSLQTIQLSALLNGNGAELTANTQIHPFTQGLNNMIGRLNIEGKNLNPAEMMPNAPKAQFDIHVSIMPTDSKNIALNGELNVINHQPSAADKNGIPVRHMKSKFTINHEGVLNIQTASAQLLHQGEIEISGNTDTIKQTLNLNAQLKNIALDDLMVEKFDDVLNGNLQATGSYQSPKLAWSLDSKRTHSDGELTIATNATHQQRTLLFQNITLNPKNGGTMTGHGSLELFGQQQFKLDIVSDKFNPNKLYPDFPEGSVNGKIALDGELNQITFNGKMSFGDSILSGAILSGSADIRYENEHLSKATSNIRLGNNQLATHGSFGLAGDKLNLDINAPDLAKFGFGLAGALNAKGFIAGKPDQLSIDLKGSANGFQIKNTVKIQGLEFAIIGSPDYSKPLKIKANGNQIILAGDSPTRIDSINADINGTGLKHGIRLEGRLALDGKPYQFNVQADGGLNQQNQWKGTVSALDIAGAFNLKLQNRMNLEAGAERVSMTAARWNAMGGRLNLDSFIWDSKNGLTSKGSADNLNVKELHHFFQSPVEHDLILAADWDLTYSHNARGHLTVRRQSGDIILPQRKQALGLAALTLKTNFQNGRIVADIQGNTRYGDLKGDMTIAQQFGNDITRAPINGKIRLNVPDLASLKNLLPVGHNLKGKLLSDVQISGSVGEPRLNGSLNGDDLYYVNREIGLILDNGNLRSRLNGQSWLIDSLKFSRGKGSINLSGTAGIIRGQPNVDITTVFNQYEALDKPRRHLTLSGNTKLIYSETNGVTLNGKLMVDEGRFGFQKSGMPTLDDDVVVLGETKKEPTSTTPINLNLILDLNDRFRFAGEGLDVTLGGQLTLTAKPKQDVQGIGTVRIVKGKYKAYAQDLNITKGAISFVGPLSNPNLNIRAVRNLSPVGAGVEVLGNLAIPRITLVADEPMSEKDKLSWLILNRASSGSDGDEAALAAAAGAFLAGGINDKLGLVDDFGFSSQRTRNAQTGELNPAEQMLTVGKQLTNELYFGYEYGIQSASQSAKLIYQLSRNIQAIARVGSVSSGGELKYVIRFD